MKKLHTPFGILLTALFAFPAFAQKAGDSFFKQNLKLEQLIQNSQKLNMKSFSKENFNLKNLSTKKEGGLSDGGGSTVTRRSDGKKILVDLYVSQPQFQDDYELAKKYPLRAYAITPLDSRIQSPQDIGYVKVRETAAYPYLKAQLAKWHTASPVVAKVLESSLDNMMFWVTGSKITPDRYVIPNTLMSDVAEVSGAAIYSRQIYGAMIDFWSFQSLGFYSQSGLILHEAFRQLQRASLDRNDVNQPLPINISDEMLQRVVADIILDRPAYSLERSDLFTGEFMKAVLGGSENSLSVKINKACELTRQIAAAGVKSSTLSELRSACQNKRTNLESLQKMHSDSYVLIEDVVNHSQQIVQIALKAQNLIDSALTSTLVSGFSQNDLALQYATFRIKYFGLAIEE